jgi:heme exporter protein C
MTRSNAPPADSISLTGIRNAVLLTAAGVAVMIYATWLVWFWVPTEALQGVVQRIYYVHIPVAWIAELAFAMCALLSAMYLWLRDDRLDAAAVSAAEAGIVFATVLLIVGPLWARVAWGEFWDWDPRLTFTLLLYFIFIGYFMVRGAARDPEAGKRFAAVVAIVGALDIPLIHMSVYWFRSLHPEPVVMRADGPTADVEIVITLMVGLLAYTMVFFGLFYLRYVIERLRRRASGAVRLVPVEA